MYYKLFSVRWLPLTETYSCNNEIGVWKRTILFSTKTDFAAKVHGTVQLLIGKKPSHLANCYITFPLNSSILSKQVFKSVSDFSALALKKVENWHFNFNFPHPTQTKFKIPTPREAVPVNLPTPRAQKIVKCLRFTQDRWCWSFNLVGALHEDFISSSAPASDWWPVITDHYLNITKRVAIRCLVLKKYLNCHLNARERSKGLSRHFLISSCEKLASEGGLTFHNGTYMTINYSKRNPHPKDDLRLQIIT